MNKKPSISYASALSFGRCSGTPILIKNFDFNSVLDPAMLQLLYFDFHAVFYKHNGAPHHLHSSQELNISAYSRVQAQYARIFQPGRLV